MIIAFDGIDCAGKNTQIDLLNDYLINHDKKVHIMSEPRFICNEKINIRTDKFNMAEMLSLFLLDRMKHVNELKASHMAKIIGLRKDILILDRYYYSTYAYQAGLHGITSIENLKKIHDFIDCPVPDIAFIFVIGYTEFIKRLAKKTPDLIESELINKKRFAKLYSAYMGLRKHFEEVIIIDGEQTKEIIHKIIINNIVKYCVVNGIDF